MCVFQDIFQFFIYEMPAIQFIMIISLEYPCTNCMIYRIYLKYIDIYVSFHPIRLNMLNFNRLVFQNREFENIITTTITEQQEHKKRVGETKNSKKKYEKSKSN